MATINPQTRQQGSSQNRVSKPSSKKQNAGTLFTKVNHKLMLIAGAVIALGFILMAGGKSPDPTQFNVNEVYSTMRITIAPLLVLIGLGLMVYAIMKNGNKPTEKA